MIQAALTASSTCAVLVGPSGWGPYQLRGEVLPAIARQSSAPQFRILPVLLPGCRDEDLTQPEVRSLFERVHRIDLRDGVQDRQGIYRLVAAIKGQVAFPEGPPVLTPARLRFDSVRWDATGRSNGSILYTGQQLEDARRLYSQPGLQSEAVVAAFLEHSAQQRREHLGRTLAQRATSLAREPANAELAAHLALEAVDRFATFEGHRVLTELTARLPRALTTFEHPTDVTAVAFAAHSPWLATGCADGAVFLWDSGTGQRLTSYRGTSAVSALAFDPDGEWLAVGDQAGSVEVRQLPNGRSIARAELDSPVTKLEVAGGATGKRLLVSSFGIGARHEICALNTSDWNTLLQQPWIDDAAILANGEQAVCANAQQVALINLTDGSIAGAVQMDRKVLFVAAHPRDPRFAAVTEDGGVWIGDPGGIRRELTIRAIRTNSALFSPCGRWLAVVSDRYELWLLEQDGDRAFSQHFRDPVNSVLAFSPNGNLICGLQPLRQEAIVWRASESKVDPRERLAEVCVLPVIGAAIAGFTADESRILLATSKNTLTLFELPREDPALWTTGPFMVRALRFADDGTSLLATCARLRNGMINLRDMHIERFAALNGARRPSGESDVPAEFVDLDADAEGGAQQFLMHPLVATACQRRGKQSAIVSSDRKWLAVQHLEHEISLWNTEPMAERVTLTAGGKVLRMAFSRHGDLLALGDDRGSIFVWSTRGTEIARMEHADSILRLAFSPDGSLLAAASSDGTLRMWLVDVHKVAGRLRERLRGQLTREQWDRYLPGEPYPNSIGRPEGLNHRPSELLGVADRLPD
jgi:WD40 repeat protein